MSPDHEFAIHVDSIRGLFGSLDAGPIAERSLNDSVRFHLLDLWDRIRDTGPSALIVYVGGTESPRTEEEAARTAIRNDLRAQTRPFWRASPLSRREKIAAWVGVFIFVITIAISTSIDQVSTDILVAGISQGIVVVGWVALWDPAQRAVGDILPHQFARKRYAEFAEIELRFAWPDATVPARRPSRESY